MQIFIPIFFLLSFSLSAESQIWSINDDHSEINFQVPYMGMAQLNGRFLSFSGEMIYDKQTEEIHDVTIELQAKSIFTGNKMRDGHLRDKDFFAVEKWPLIHFKSHTIIVQAPNVYKVDGELVIKGQRRKASFNIQKTAIKKDTWKRLNIFAKFSSIIKRSDFNLNWNKTLAGNEFLIGDDISVSGVFQFQPQGQLTAGSKHKIPDSKHMRKMEQYQRGELNSSQTPMSHSPVQTTPFFADKKKSRPTHISTVENTKEALTMGQLYLVLMAFLGSIATAIGIKKIILNVVKDRFEETNAWGFLGDFLGIGLFFLFAVASYQLNWMF